MSGVTRDLRYRPAWLAIGYLLVAATAWGSLDPSPPNWAFSLGDKPLHAGTYALLTFWFGQLYAGWKRQLGLVGAFALLGAALEVMQAWWSIYRHFDVADAVASAIGALAAWCMLRTALGRLLAVIDRELALRAG